MNTVDPNEKVVAPGSETSHHEVADTAPVECQSEAPVEAAAPEKGESVQVSQENLPKFHHHRSTALW